MRSLQKVFVRLRSRAQRFPRECLGLFSILERARFFLMSDNTVKEVRNQFAARMYCTLLQGNVFDTISQGHLGVGHTHEDVDGCLSLCKAAMDSCSSLETPADVISCLRSRLEPFFSERGLDFHVEEVSSAPRPVPRCFKTLVGAVKCVATGEAVGRPGAEPGHLQELLPDQKDHGR